MVLNVHRNHKACDSSFVFSALAYQTERGHKQWKGRVLIYTHSGACDNSCIDPLSRLQRERERAAWREWGAGDVQRERQVMHIRVCQQLLYYHVPV